ncbi:hypothetical protein SUGI_0249060 [Cryptomeria japonica]|nr:hypothetical protein SUGI_0249060 [Cryptomeria japonica]
MVIVDKKTGNSKETTTNLKCSPVKFGVYHCDFFYPQLIELLLILFNSSGSNHCCTTFSTISQCICDNSFGFATRTSAPLPLWLRSFERRFLADGILVWHKCPDPLHTGLADSNATFRMPNFRPLCAVADLGDIISISELLHCGSLEGKTDLGATAIGKKYYKLLDETHAMFRV